MSTAAAASALARDLAGIVGEANTCDDPKLLGAMAIDGVVPRIAVSPGSPQEVAAVLRLAWKDGLVIVPAGGFTHQGTGAIPPEVDIVVRSTRLTAVEHYDPGDLTVGVGAGTTLGQLDQMVAANRQMLPLDTAHADTATVGGILAVNAEGPLKHAFGGVRDYCIGVRFATADGKLAKGGGRVVKNVAGYDMMKLLIGSYGTLGVIVGASFKLFPRPQQTRTFICSFAGAAGALQFRDRIQRSPLAPMCLEVVSPRAHVVLGGEANGPDAEAWRLLLRAGGSDAILNRYRKELGAAVTREVDGDAEASLWRHYAEFAEAAVARSHNAMLVAVHIPAQSAEAVIAAAQQAALDNNFVCAVTGRIGIGSLLIAFMPVAVDPPGAVLYVNAMSAFRGALPRDGSAIVLRCPLEAKRHFSVWGSSPTDLESMRAVKQALDAKDILNRGRFLF